MSKNTTNNLAPAITLILLAPLITEVLPGATRFSSLFVFPVQICVWGSGALLIRYVIRRWQLGWKSMLLLGLALSMAEEFLIQQTSIAPLVIHLKGATYARALGINYVYLLWALIYESVSVVMLPVYLTELIFPDRKKDVWISKGGVMLFSVLFLLGSFVAWFTWTQIARIKVFHVPAYTPTFPLVALAVIVIVFLIFWATKKSAAKSFQKKIEDACTWNSDSVRRAMVHLVVWAGSSGIWNTTVVSSANCHSCWFNFSGNANLFFTPVVHRSGVEWPACICCHFWCNAGIDAHLISWIY
jgi:hypothetical protein